MFPRFEGQSPGLHGPVDRVYGYLEGFPALDLFRRPAFLEPSPEKGLQLFVLQLEGRPAAFATQTIELVCLVGTVGSLDEITPELPADRRWTSVQSTGNLADSVSLSTKTQYTFSLCCCKMPPARTDGGNPWVSVSFAVCALAKLIYRE